MINRFAIILLILIMFSLTGCSDKGKKALKVDGDTLVQPNMIVYADKDDRFYYAVDERTDVVYIMYTYGESFASNAVGGITVAYNGDGTVMKRERLEKLINETS